ncbi:DNA polymerase alpha primase subunit [Dictyostelium discoideum AX4]|uniref:DNA primase large subunit n=1 Tax=Dictyostelium discoideum TaxID=44689 RepID=PRI2_DICDI|nr:DNA polymerase alpha primase subunit [Dictyostelium discoideum AX4]Q55BM5.1 RecName: Full=DNA primase large subunit [Dictyostelium discoideum]EAL72571.1 DNA polymerase alpha primase subunit [Dictyostelium discoideum AX4]|eukprot:XP_646806.1 DNA polymerase alpha primase subunit [Dictyostelium discoideum AX4]
MLRAGKKTNSQTSTSNDACSLLYINVPDFNCNMSQIENYCIDRFNLLNEVSKLKDTLSAQKSNTSKDNEDFRNLSSRFLGSTKDEQFKIKDELSHYCLRLAMCDSTDRNWFITTESILLANRLNQSDLTTIISSFKGFGWSPVSQEEYEQYQDDLGYLVKKANLNLNEVNNTHFYKLPFQDIPKLIDTKKAIIIKGEAYIYISNFKDMVIHTFKNYMNFALDRIKADKTRIKEEFPELIQFFTTLPKAGDGTNKPQLGNTKHIRKEDVSPLSKTSFPMCMRVMYDSLVETSSLKYEGRLQFGTFLKGIGLPYDEAINFWRIAFSKRVSNTDFDKEYLYNIRHNYGLEGKSTNYSPYSCPRIISKSPHNGDKLVHGCPYIQSLERLEQKLLDLGIDDFQRIQILEATKTSPNVACTKHFNFLHPNNTLTKLINHPNQFYDQSMEYYKTLEEKKSAKQSNNKENENQSIDEK